MKTLIQISFKVFILSALLIQTQKTVAQSVLITPSKSLDSDTLSVQKKLVVGAKFASKPTNKFEVFSNNKVRLAVDGAGKVGVGTDIPQNTLHVEGRTQINGKLFLNTKRNIPGSVNSSLLFASITSVSQSQDSSDIALVLYEDSDYSPWLNFGKARGNFSVPANVQQNDYIFKILGSAYNNNDFNDAGSIELFVDGIPTSTSLPSAMRFSTSREGNVGSISSMIIRSSGNVGIGTENPQEQLSITQGMNIDQINQNDGQLQNGLRFGDSSGEGIASKRTMGGNQYGLDFYTSNNNRMTINNIGNVGIGNITPTQKLDINGSTNINGDLYLKSFKVLSNGGLNNTLTVNGILELSNNLKTNNKWISSDGDNEGLKVDSDGNVGVNEVNSNVVLTVKGSKMDLFLVKNASDSFKFLINQNGNVGIGTADLTKAKLTITGSMLTNLNYGYFNAQGNSGTASGSNYYSVYASDRIAATEFNAFSDARIKDIVGISNNEKDLETLSKIEITDYQFKDKIGKGNGQYKKVIAQQVETVYPQAVSKITDCIPDIYRLAKIENSFIELPNHTLKIGEKVKLIFDDKQDIFEVKEANEHGFQIINPKSKIVNQQVFVYGREVSDFRSVDYEALSMLNVSATQALLKRLNEVEKKIVDLEIQQTRIKDFEARLSALENPQIQLSSTKK